jgi:hypothetical protein
MREQGESLHPPASRCALLREGFSPRERGANIPVYNDGARENQHGNPPVRVTTGKAIRT